MHCVSVAFSNGHLSRDAGDRLEKAAGGVAGSPGAERLAVSGICPVTEIRIQSAAGSSGAGCGSLFVSNGSNQGNIFELTGLCSGVRRKTVLQLLSRVVPQKLPE